MLARHIGRWVVNDRTVAAHRAARRGGPFLAPPTAAKIRRRNRTYRALTSRLLLPLFVKLTEGAANAMTLDAYPPDQPAVAR